MEKDTPVSEMPRSEPEVNDQADETDKTEFASQQQQEQPSTVTTNVWRAMCVIIPSARLR